MAFSREGRRSENGTPVMEESNYPVQQKCDKNCENDGTIIGQSHPCLHLFCRQCRADPLLTSNCKVCNDVVKNYHALDLTTPRALSLNGMDAKKCSCCKVNDFIMCNRPCGHCVCGDCFNQFLCSVCEKTAREYYMVEPNSFFPTGEQFGEKFNLTVNCDMSDHETTQMKCSQCRKFSVRIAYKKCGHCVCTGCAVDKKGRFCGVCGRPVEQLWAKEICL